MVIHDDREILLCDVIFMTGLCEILAGIALMVRSNHAKPTNGQFRTFLFPFVSLIPFIKRLYGRACGRPTSLRDESGFLLRLGFNAYSCQAS